jgi:hypothetical protein
MAISLEKTHDTIRDTFVAIVRDASFHVGPKQLHAFPSNTFNSSYRRIDIVFIKDGIYILIDVFNAPNMGRFTSSIL